MILADKILYHRKKLGLSQEELAEQLGVSRQSISKWEGAQSIPDMDKIIKLSNLFSVSIDYLMKDEIEEPEYVEGMDNGTLRRVSLEEATTFIEANKKYAKNMAVGVFLCVSAPALLIMADKFFKNGSLGMLILIPMIAIAVAVFIRAIHFMEPYKYLKEDSFELEYGVDSAVKREKEKYRNEHVKYLSLGVVLIIISIIPAIVSDVLIRIPILSSLAPSLLIAMVAIGVHLLVRASCTD